MTAASLPSRRRGRRAPRPADSCRQCLAWGTHGGLCRACENFTATYPPGPCTTCLRVVAVKGGVCRLCHKQAGLIAGPHNKTRVDLSVAARTGQQLFFADMARSISLAAARHARAAPPSSPSRPTLRLTRPGWRQVSLFDPPLDLRRVSSLSPPHDPALLTVLIARAETIAALRGWNARTLGQVRRGLRILAACHHPGEPINASTVHQLTVVGLTSLRVHDVLADLGLIVEDRADSLDIWLDERLGDLPAQIRTEVNTWITVLRDGDQRRRPRARATIVTHIYSISPFLNVCAERYTTLRQVTRDDITTWLQQRPSKARDGCALRGLFGVLKQRRLVFTNPTRGVHTGRNRETIPVPIAGHDLRTAAETARGNVALRVVIALAGVHALHPYQIRDLELVNIDLPNRRLRFGGLDRPLDEFTATAIGDYLVVRHARWPHTANRHLLLTRRSAQGVGPVSEYWFNKLFRGLPVTAQRLREDRLIEEGIARSADPLHLAAVFAIGPRTGLRYATAAHNTLTTNEPTAPTTRG